MLVLDPSIGSQSSQPGYAIYEKGELVESGVIEMPTSASTARRLYYLGKCLREQFHEKYDVVLIELIPALRFNKFGRSLQSQIPLHYAVAVCMSSFDTDCLLEISPSTWRSYADEQHLVDKKNKMQGMDEQDAICMGHSVLEIATYLSTTPVSRKKKVSR